MKNMWSWKEILVSTTVCNVPHSQKKTGQHIGMKCFLENVHYSSKIYEKVNRCQCHGIILVTFPYWICIY